MVVVSIIGILSTITFASFSQAQKKGRIAKRVSDLKQVQVALEYYYAVNKTYPSTGGAHRGICASYNGGGAYTAANGQVIPGLAPNYITQIPVDPQSNSSIDVNCYLYISNGTDYAFIDHQVSELYDGSAGGQYSTYPQLVDPARPTTAWKVYSPGGVNF